MKQFRESAGLGSTRLSRAQLGALVALIAAEFPERSRQNDFSISATAGSAVITAQDWEDFLKHPEVQTVLDNINVRHIGWNADRQIDRSIEVSLYKNHGHVIVSGDNRAWVSGLAKILERELRACRAPGWWAKTSLANGLIGFLSALALIMAVAGVMQIASNGLVVGTFLLVSAGFIAVGIVAMDRQPFIVVDLRDDQPRTFTLQIKIAIAALFVSCVSAAMAIANFLLK